MRTRSGLAVLTALASLAPTSASASLFSGDTLDAVATGLAWFVVLVVPLVAIAIFFFVHILPEKIAEKNHHPQQHAIKTLCMLSLFFGGLLWPLAWLWAYTRPVAFRMAYGTEKHENYFIEMGEKAEAGQLDSAELEHLREEIVALAATGPLAPKLRHVAMQVARAKDKLDAGPATPPAAPGGAA